MAERALACTERSTRERAPAAHYPWLNVSWRALKDPQENVRLTAHYPWLNVRLTAHYPWLNVR
ncbi:hypothetical protein GCM10010439_70830 [Actinocorallia aurantiaca]|uniref:Uncharacterized protein n=1 Tax=Actinocorallia aurantiaca TaxID=46204 RepID=A0ABP6H7Z9_9ACTN